MRVVYDISVLGAGYENKRTRTGIFMAVESIVKALISSNECTLSFSATEHYDSILSSLKYLTENQNVYNNIYLSDRRNPLKKTLDQVKDALSSKIVNNSNFNIFYKVLRRITIRFDKSLTLWSPPIDSPLLGQSDVFHSPFYPIPTYIRNRKHLKCFLTVYDLIPLLFPQYFAYDEKDFILKIMKNIEQNTNIFCISQSTKNDLCNYLPYLDPNRVTVTYLAASDFFYPALKENIHKICKKYQIPEGEYFLSLCTLEKRKNIDHLIRCFSKLVLENKIGQDAFLVLAGPKGWKDEKIYEEITKFKWLRERIIVTGFIADEDLAPLYSGSLAFVYPSLYEGFGLPPLEAMQCGVPVITSNTSSLPEVVGDAGIMVNPDDEDELCQKMLDVYRDSSLRKSLSERSIERAKKFSWDTCGQKMISAFKQALNS